MDSLILFAKAPIKGSVKTRLLESTPLNEDDVTLLYTAFLYDSMTVANRCRSDVVYLHFTPNDAEGEMKDIANSFLKDKQVVLSPQKGSTFVERIEVSFAEAGRNGGAVVMIGSDCPTLTAEKIDTAFSALAGGADLVLGPSGEGGIYLIGFNAGADFDYRQIFGNGAELANFAHQAKEKSLRLHLLEELSDIDVATDLVTLIALMEAMTVAGKPVPGHTAQAIATLGLVVERVDDTRGKRVVKRG